MLIYVSCVFVCKVAFKTNKHTYFWFHYIFAVFVTVNFTLQLKKETSRLGQKIIVIWGTVLYYFKFYVLHVFDWVSLFHYNSLTFVFRVNILFIFSLPLIFCAFGFLIFFSFLISIEDPFENTYNVAHVINLAGNKKITSEFEVYVSFV